MKRLRMGLAGLSLIAITALSAVSVHAQVVTGALGDGSTYLIEVPPNWNKTLFLYSHGYVVPG
ncbi:MAG: hypothetical protein JOZ10_09070, partial [Acidobacteria bacterium]|nr:hypothetical protein [Acidobacteriota bacterium]